MVIYQFYCLFFTQRLTQTGKITEPDTLAEWTHGDDIYTSTQQPHISCARQGEKRLFRIHAEHPNRLDDQALNQAMTNAYQTIIPHYQTEQGNVSEHLLFAVSVVIIDADFIKDDDYTLRLPIQTKPQHMAAFNSDTMLMRLDHAESQQRIFWGEFSLNTQALPATLRLRLTCLQGLLSQNSGKKGFTQEETHSGPKPRVNKPVHNKPDEDC